MSRCSIARTIASSLTGSEFHRRTLSSFAETGPTKHTKEPKGFQRPKLLAFSGISRHLGCLVGDFFAAVIDRRYSIHDEGSGRKKAGIGLNIEDRIARGGSVEGMGHDREQLCAVCQNSGLSA